MGRDVVCSYILTGMAIYSAMLGMSSKEIIGGYALRLLLLAGIIITVFWPIFLFAWIRIFRAIR